MHLSHASGARRAPISTLLEVTKISEAEAERLLAAIWRILEAHALGSPMMDVRSPAQGLIDLRLIFRNAADCALVEANLPMIRCSYGTF
jgi:hypothetical protein